MKLCACGHKESEHHGAAGCMVVLRTIGSDEVFCACRVEHPIGATPSVLDAFLAGPVTTKTGGAYRGTRRR